MRGEYTVRQARYRLSGMAGESSLTLAYCSLELCSLSFLLRSSLPLSRQFNLQFHRTAYCVRSPLR